MKNRDSEPDSSSSTQGSGNILRQLHEADSQGVERKREIVVRPDGTKVIRVEKRRRAYQEKQDEEKREGQKNKRFLIGLCVLALILISGITGTYMYRLASFNTPECAARLQDELSAAWGGKVVISGLTVDGRIMTASKITVSFPEDSCLSFVSLERVTAELSAVSVFMGKVKGESLNVGNAMIGLRQEYTAFSVPRAGGALPFAFQRFTSPRLEVGYAHERNPFTLDRNAGAFYLAAEAYIRTLKTGSSTEYVLDMSEQKLKIKGWPLMAMDVGSVIVDDSGIRQLSFSGRVERGEMFNKPTDITSCMITGTFRLGGDFRSRIWTLTGRNFDLSQLVGDSLASILKVQMGEQAIDERKETHIMFSLPVDGNQKTPSLKGFSGSVIKASLKRLPVLDLLAAMTRKTDSVQPYDSPIFSSGSFNLESDGTGQTIILSDISLFEQNFLGLSGSLACGGQNLQGELVFKIPSYMVDTHKIPSGVRQEGREFIVTTNLSGTTLAPSDQSGNMLLELRKRQEEHMPALPAASAPSSAVRPAGGVTVDGFM